MIYLSLFIILVIVCFFYENHCNYRLLINRYEDILDFILINKNTTKFYNAFRRKYINILRYRKKCFLYKKSMKKEITEYEYMIFRSIREKNNLQLFSVYQDVLKKWAA